MYGQETLRTNYWVYNHTTNSNLSHAYKGNNKGVSVQKLLGMNKLAHTYFGNNTGITIHLVQGTVPSCSKLNKVLS